MEIEQNETGDGIGPFSPDVCQEPEHPLPDAAVLHPSLVVPRRKAAVKKKITLINIDKLRVFTKKILINILF